MNMDLRGRTTFVLATTLLLIPCTARTAAAQQVWVGARAGFVVSEALFEDDINDGRTDPRLGWQFGAVAALGLSPYADIRMEAVFSEKGWTEFDTGGGRRFGYLDLPLVLTVRLPRTFSPQLSLGAYTAFEVSCAVTGVPRVGSVSCDEPAVAARRRRTDFGILAGIGLGQVVAGGALLAEFTVMLGLRDLKDEPFPPGSQRLSTVSLTARFMLPAGG